MRLKDRVAIITGAPTREKLTELGLKYIADELAERK
jgi:hypothetical protein